MDSKELLKDIEKDIKSLNDKIQSTEKKEKNENIIKQIVSYIFIIVVILTLIYLIISVKRVSDTKDTWISTLAIVFSSGSFCISFLSLFNSKSNTKQMEKLMFYLREITIFNIYNSKEIQDKDKADIIKKIKENK